MNIVGLLLSVLVGVSLGLLGGGGSILTLPILMYAFELEEKQAIAASLAVVCITSATAVISHARSGNVQWRTGLLFACASSVGAFLGGTFAEIVPGRWLVNGFLIMMLGTAVAMIRGRKDRGETREGPLPVGTILADGLCVGLAAGLVGAGGGFLIVPALVLHGGLPMQKAVGTALVVISIQSLFGYLGHATHVSIDVALTAQVSCAAVVGSLFGGILAPMIPAASLRKGFGVFVLVMATYMGMKQFGVI